ncbi:MAG: AgmX/PglI C-terminal domain-containing protein [Bdellovibrionaceae bacterium]|nr:AgmX/PglI C-terminal domain-containing protein [Pseudobdellovibrionaceae bacterium]
MSAKKLVLENKLGQRVRSFDVEAAESNLIYRQDTRRVELHTDLAVLDEAGVSYQVIKKVSVRSLEKTDLKLAGIGVLRLAEENETATLSPTYELPKEEDDEKMALLLKKTAIGHGAVVALLVLVSIGLSYFNQKEKEPQLVTIVMPEKKEPVVREKKQHIQVSEKKIVQKKTNIKKVSNKTVISKVTQKRPEAVKKAPTPVVRQQKMVVRNDNMQNVQNVGALAALGGLKNGTRGYEGLDANSLKKIRSAGVGSGGGGVGEGRGGVRGVLPGTGLIAGSSGSGGRAEGAGGYGTKGQGGGRAGYGKISLVGGTSGISLPLDDEASIEGGLDRDQIAAVINRNQGQIIYCYEQGLQNENGNLRGRVTVDFVINGSGRVSTARVSQTSLRSKMVENCMISKLRTWQFPRPVGNVNVDVAYPFELRRVTSR